MNALSVMWTTFILSRQSDAVCLEAFLSQKKQKLISLIVFDGFYFWNQSYAYNSGRRLHLMCRMAGSCGHWLALSVIHRDISSWWWGEETLRYLWGLMAWTVACGLQYWISRSRPPTNSSNLLLSFYTCKIQLLLSIFILVKAAATEMYCPGISLFP